MISRACRFAIEYLFYILFFILPLVFFPKTSEVFEFNKIVTVYIFTVLITGAWVIKMIQAKKILFKRTILDIPLLIFIGSQIISTVLSIDPHTSIFGYYSRFNGGLLSTVCYAILYFAFVNNMTREKTKKLILITLISAGIVAVYGILEHFGASISCIFVSGKFDDNCWVQDVRTRVFATLGQPNWLAAYLISLVPLTLHYAVNANAKRLNKNTIIGIGVSVIFFLCILFTKSRSGLLGLAVACAIFGIFNFKKYLKELIIIAILFLGAIAIFGTDVTPSISQFINHKQVAQATADQGEGGTESGAIRQIVWKGALQIFSHYPIFGTGVETFGYSYWQFRPIEHNATSEWDYLYNKAHNEYLNYLANTGTIGLITYLIFIGTCIWVLRKNAALLAGFISILITNFFGFSVVVISLFTFLFPAIAITLNEKNKENKYGILENNQKLFIGGIVLAAGFLIYQIGKYWIADYRYNYAQNEINVGQYSQSVKDIESAIKNEGSEAIYHNEAARIFSAVTVGFLDAKQATDAAQIAPYAINETDIAFALSPRNMNIRETRMSVFLELSPFDSSYTQKAIDLINDTILLSPTDPKLPLLLAKTYANEGKFDLAISEINKALKLKSDYADAKTALVTVQKLQSAKKK